MSKVRVVFQTTPVPTTPVKDGPFAGCSRMESMTYVRCFDIDRSKFNVLPPRDKITFYGKEYKICSISISHSEIGITLSEKEMIEFLAKAKANGHHWKAKIENRVDGRGIIRADAYRMSLN